MTKRTRIIVILLCFCLALFSVATYSFMFRTTDTTENNFEPGRVGAVLSGTTVTNDGNTPAFVRIRFVAYYKVGDNIAGVASPAITCSNLNGWLQGTNDTYYYPAPVDPNEAIAIPTCTAADKDGYTLVIEAIAEAIQANPKEAAQSAWGVTVTDGEITSVS